MNLVALVNSFNRVALLQRAVPALRAALADWPGGAAVVVFDAGSCDGSREWIAREAERVPGVPLELLTPAPGAARSFSAGLNAAAAAGLARHRQAAWLFCFETDNWIAGPRPVRAAAALLAEQPGLGAVGFTVRRHDGSPAGYGARFPTVAGFILGPQLSHRLRLETPPREPRTSPGAGTWWACDVVYTSPLLVRRAAWEQSGGLDASRYPFSECDVDWAWRLRGLGWRQAVIQTADVVHDHRAQPSAWSARRSLDFHRARLALLRQHRGAAVGCVKPLLGLRHLGEWLALAALAAAGRRPAAAAAARLELLRSVGRDYETEPATARRSVSEGSGPPRSSPLPPRDC